MPLMESESSLVNEGRCQIGGNEEDSSTLDLGKQRRVWEDAPAKEIEENTAMATAQSDYRMEFLAESSQPALQWQAPDRAGEVNPIAVGVSKANEDDPSVRPSNDWRRGKTLDIKAETASRRPHQMVLLTGAPALQLETRLGCPEDSTSPLASPEYSSPWQHLLLDTIHPRGLFKYGWDLLLSLILLSWVCIVLPYVIGFDIPNSLPSVLGIVELCVNILFFLDMLVSFNTGFYGEDKWGRPIDDRQEIARQYASTWLLVDIFSCIPWNSLAFAIEQSQYNYSTNKAHPASTVKLLSVLRMLKILKLVRLVQSRDFIAQVEKRLGSTVLRVGGSVLAGVMMVHMAACMFFYIALLEGLHNLCWVSEAQLQDAENYERYVAAVYWAVATMATVGYGDISSVTVAERIYSIVIVCIGATSFAYYLGTIANLVTAANMQATRVAAEKQAIDDFLTARRVPAPLAKRVREYYAYVLDKQFEQQDMRIISGLSQTLRTDLVLSLHAATVEKVPFLRHKHPQFIASVVLAFKLEFYGVDEYIIKQGQVGTEMFFVSEGSLEVRYELDAAPHIGKARSKGKKIKTSLVKGLAAKKAVQHQMDVNPPSESSEPRYEVKKKLSAGEYFGEHGVLTGEPRSASVVATTFCEIYTLSRQALLNAIEEWPELAEELNLMCDEDDNSELILAQSVETDPSGPAAIQQQLSGPLDANPSSTPSPGLDTQQIPAGWLERMPVRTLSEASTETDCEDRRRDPGTRPVSTPTYTAGSGTAPRSRVPLYVFPPDQLDGSPSSRRGSRPGTPRVQAGGTGGLGGRGGAGAEGGKQAHISFEGPPPSSPHSFSVGGSEPQRGPRMLRWAHPHSFTDKCELSRNSRLLPDESPYGS